MPLAFRLWLLHACLCLQQGGGACTLWLALLWYSLNPLFCELARLQVRLEPFTGKFSFFLSLSLAIPQFGLVSQVSSLRLSSGHSGLVPTLSIQTSPPCPAPTPWWQTLASRLLFCWELWLATSTVDFFFFPPNYVALRDSKTPHRPASERVSCCLETSFSCLPP